MSITGTFIALRCGRRVWARKEMSPRACVWRVHDGSSIKQRYVMDLGIPRASHREIKSGLSVTFIAITRWSLSINTSAGLLYPSEVGREREGKRVGRRIIKFLLSIVHT